MPRSEATHLVLVGPTAAGKSALAMVIARLRPDEIELVSVDSMQVYRGMDIGTAKPTRAERDEVRHHVLDLVDPSEEFSVARFQREVADALADVESRGNRAILVGGTGLYVRAIVDDLDIPSQWPEVREQLEQEDDTERLHRRLAELDPVAAARMEATNRRRVVRALEVTLGSGRAFSSFGPGLGEHPPTPRFFQVGLAIDRDLLTRRIADRFHRMLEDGLLDEIRRLHTAERPMSKTARQALGYRELLGHLEQGVPFETAVADAIQRTRTFAVRQERWFRRDPRIVWYPVDDGTNIDALAERVLGDWDERCAR